MPAAVDSATWAKADWPLGARVDPDGASTTFAVFAPAATRVVLELYPQAMGADATAEFAMEFNPADGVWRAKLSGAGAGTLYALRCWGPNWPFQASWARGGSGAGFVCDHDAYGNRFNPNKALFDPYARELTHNVFSDELLAAGVDDGVFGTGDGVYRGRPRREVDSGPWVPKGIVVDNTTLLRAKPRLAAENTVVYEAHVKALSGHPSSASLRAALGDLEGFADVVDVPADVRGTYLAAGLMAPYLKGLGFTTIELLPVHETNHSESCRAGKTNFWGYMTLAFFAPNRLYAHDRSPGGPTREFKAMVDAFHAAGLEVYLDVVYNHSAEGGNWNNDVNTTGFVSLGGFATAEYYSLTGDARLVDGATGTSNQLNHSSAASQALVLDSLAYWADDMGVDGFRFDLAPVLGRKPAAAARDDWDDQKRFFPDHPLLIGIAKLAQDRDLEVIAEAWDLWGYEVGNFPPGWGEWNGRFRDAVRGFAKGDGNTTDFIDMMNGDYHHFADQGGPQRSINFVTAHDGFTLADLVSYPGKANDQPYPFGPSDGGNDANMSWDSGGSQPLRRQRLRNFWTLLMFSRGVPMLVAGDEFGRTQNGNNNPWAIDTIAMYNNYEMAATNHPQAVLVDPDQPEWRYHDNLGTFAGDDNGLFRFAAYLAHFRQGSPLLRQRRWGNLTADDDDVSYLAQNPGRTGYPRPGDRALQLHINSARKGDLLMLINMSDRPCHYTLQPRPQGLAWKLIVDTSTWAEDVDNHWRGEDASVIAGTYTVQPWAIAVLQEA